MPFLRHNTSPPQSHKYASFLRLTLAKFEVTTASPLHQFPALLLFPTDRSSLPQTVTAFGEVFHLYFRESCDHCLRALIGFSYHTKYAIPPRDPSDIRKSPPPIFREPSPSRTPFPPGCRAIVLTIARFAATLRVEVVPPSLLKVECAALCLLEPFSENHTPEQESFCSFFMLLIPLPSLSFLDSGRPLNSVSYAYSSTHRFQIFRVLTQTVGRLFFTNQRLLVFSFLTAGIGRAVFR